MILRPIEIQKIFLSKQQIWILILMQTFQQINNDTKFLDYVSVGQTASKVEYLNNNLDLNFQKKQK
jgi:hypothetical protein